MAEAPKITIPDTLPTKFKSATMAYGGMANEARVGDRLYRLERGFVFLRGGVPVAAIPQFKGLTLYSHSTNAPAPFQTSQTGKNVKWPSPPGKAR